MAALSIRDIALLARLTRGYLQSLPLTKRPVISSTMSRKTQQQEALTGQDINTMSEGRYWSWMILFAIIWGKLEKHFGHWKNTQGSEMDCTESVNPQMSLWPYQSPEALRPPLILKSVINCASRYDIWARLVWNEIDVAQCVSDYQSEGSAFVHLLPSCFQSRLGQPLLWISSSEACLAGRSAL